MEKQRGFRKYRWVGGGCLPPTIETEKEHPCWTFDDENHPPDLMENERSGEEGRRSLQQVWSWGAGTEGQLGTGKLEDECLPRLLPHFNSSRPISLLACGGAHVIALTSDGKVMSWGRGTSGQLGHGDMANSLHPKALDFLESHSITQVSAGWSHSGFVSDTGWLFACGDGSFGQLGLGDCRSRATPTKVSFFDHTHVEQMKLVFRSCFSGKTNLVQGFLSPFKLHPLKVEGPSDNQVYSFGSGKRGQLGLGRERLRSVTLPHLIPGFEDADLVSISANGDHSAALSADGHLYTWGRGFGGAHDDNSPKPLASSLRFCSVALGWNHALLVTGDGGLFMLGGSHHGALSSLDHTSNAKEFSDPGEALMARVSSPDEVRVVQGAAGAEHSILVTESGEIKTWGWGEHGQLGLGDTGDQIEPQAVDLPRAVEDEEAMVYVCCGSGFTYAIRSISVKEPDDTSLT